MNYIYYGEFVAGRGPVDWVSPDLNVAMTPAVMTADGGFTITHPKITLVGRPQGDGFAIERTK